MHNLASLIIIVASIILLFVLLTPNTYLMENYGGPIKNVRKIPLNDCNISCQREYEICTDRYPSNFGVCSDRREGCLGQCYYSNYQRL